jgi:hypothetical protein
MMSDDCWELSQGFVACGKELKGRWGGWGAALFYIIG